MQGIPLFQAVSASMADTSPQITSPFTKNLNIIKYQIYVPWNDEKAKQKMIIKNIR